jgi:hypothetical protein
MNNVSRQTGRAVLAAAGPLVWHIAANPSLRLRIERNSLDQDRGTKSQPAAGAGPARAAKTRSFAVGTACPNGRFGREYGGMCKSASW